jgi:glycosyltransferase involved in cell wall biosynthesis
MKPFFSCIVTAFNEGETARVSLESLLAQSFTDFEVIVVHDGVDKATEEILLGYQDPRLVHIAQFNDGLSSARNRAIPHCKGEYICFLDADDLRPNWAFDSVHQTIVSNNMPDCVFSPGLLVELRNEVMPFYDQPIFDYFVKMGQISFEGRALDEQLSKVMLIEPQAANKFVRKEIIDKHKLRYPTGLVYEDMLFHAGICASMESFAINTSPAFTYFRRYGRPQITSGTGLNRMDAISMAFITLKYWENCTRFTNKAASSALFLSLFKLVRWCEESISHFHRWHYSHAVSKQLDAMNESWFSIIDGYEMANISSDIPWAAGVFEYVKTRMEHRI